MRGLKTLQKGFTLGEMLIVITTIGVLASLILNSVSSAQARARDAKRRADIDAITKALTAYSIDKGSLAVSGTGASNSGIGWIDYGGPSSGYSKSILAGLRELGYLKDNNLKNPKPDPSFLGSYMIVSCTTSYWSSSTFAVAVKMEKPSTKDTSAYSAWKSSCPDYASALDSVGMNFVRVVYAGF